MNTQTTDATTLAAAEPLNAAAAGPDICVIMNAGSGDRRDGRAAELERLFDAHPGRFALRQVQQGDQIVGAAERAVEEGFRTIVAAGGDGTICAVAGVLAGSGRRLGILPMGTFNYFARSLDLPEELDLALAVIAGDGVRTVPIGEINGRVFLNNASLGLYAAILRERERIYLRWGRSRLAAYWSVLRTLIDFRKPLRLKVTVDGDVRRFKTPLVFVANNPYQLELFELAGADCLRAGQFAVFVAPDCGRLELILYAIRLAFRSMHAAEDFELLCGREVVVETPRRHLLVARDGERDRLSAPFRFTRHDDALEVMAPAGRS